MSESTKSTRVQFHQRNQEDTVSRQTTSQFTIASL